MEPARIQFWRNKKQWTLNELAFLLKGKEPVPFLEMLPESAAKKEITQLTHDLYEFAAHDRRMQTSDPHTGKYVAPTHSIDSRTLLQWVSQLEGIEIPKQLTPLLPKAEPIQNQNKWGYTHDTKLLRTCRWVVENYWEEADFKEVSSKPGVVADLREKFELSDREAQAVDLVTRHDRLRKP